MIPYRNHFKLFHFLFYIQNILFSSWVGSASQLLCILFSILQMGELDREKLVAAQIKLCHSDFLHMPGLPTTLAASDRQVIMSYYVEKRKYKPDSHPI